MHSGLVLFLDTGGEGSGRYSRIVFSGDGVFYFYLFIFV